MNNRKPACIFYTKEDVGKCLLFKINDNIKKFNLYASRTDEWKSTYACLPRCPFIKCSDDELYAFNHKCNACEKKEAFLQAAQEAREISKLEDRGF